MPSNRPPKRKATLKDQPSENESKIEVSNPDLDRGLKPAPNKWIVLSLILLAILLVGKGRLLFGEVIMGAVVLFLIFPLRLPSMAKRKEQLPSSPGLTWLPIFCLALFWLGFALELASFPNHLWMFPSIPQFPFPQSQALLLTCFVGMIFSMKYLNPIAKMEDMPVKLAWVFLFVFMVCGSFLQLYQWQTPFGSYWNDQTMEIAAARSVFDLDDYRSAFVLHSGHGISTAPIWSMVFLWHLFPNANGFLIQRLVTTLVDLLGMFILYMLGKELGGRRIGVFAVGLAAVSKPLIIKSLGNIQSVEMPMVEALVLWLLLRAIRKPTLVNFVFWGLSVSLGVYVYSVFRPFVLFFFIAGAVLIWFEHPEERKFDKSIGIWIGSTFFFFITYLLYMNGLFVVDNWLSRIIDVSGSWLPCMVMALLLMYLSVNRLKMKKLSAHPSWMGWTAAAWICIFLTFPVFSEPFLRDQLLETNSVGAHGFNVIFDPFQTLRDLVLSMQDSAAYNIPGDSFFSYLEIVVGVLGIAWVIARPNLINLFLLASFLAGIAPYLFAAKPTHSLKLMNCLPPLLLMSGLALDQVWGFFSKSSFRRMIQIGLGILFLAFWAWSGQKVFDRIYRQWSIQWVGYDTLDFLEARKAQQKGDRVFVAGYHSDSSSPYVLFERNPVYTLHPSNTLYMGPHDPPQNLEIILWPTDLEMKKKIQSIFPSVAWENIYNNPNHEPNVETADNFIVSHCEIPFDLLAKSPQTLFAVQTTSEPNWTREFSVGSFGLSMAVIDWEDKTPFAQDPIPPQVDLTDELVRYSATINITREGDYEITGTTSNRTRMSLDEHPFIDLRFSRTSNYSYQGPDKVQSKRVYLHAGPHTVEVTTLFQRSKAPPAVSIHLKGDPSPPRSLWSGFVF